MAAVFQRGVYVPVEVTRDEAEFVVAFTRGEKVLAAVPRLAYTRLGGSARLPLETAWGHGELIVPEMAGAALENAFTGERVRVSQDGRLPLSVVFGEFPVALLVRQ
jgi:maltooligosyltrehalose synthase